MDDTPKQQLGRVKAQRRHWEVILEDHEKHLSTAMLNCRVAALELDNVKLHYGQAPRKIKEMDLELMRLTNTFKKEVIDPRVKRIINLRAQLEKLEREEDEREEDDG